EYKGQKIKITQESNYPWDGDASFVMEELPTNYALKVRIPGWAEGAEITKNNEKIAFQTENGYAVLSSGLKKGDRITLHLPMNVTFMEANPLVEEARNQVAVMRGPVVYCLEKADVPENADVFDLKINASSSFEPVVESVLGQPIVFLQGNAYTDNTEKWNALYRKVSADE